LFDAIADREIDEFCRHALLGAAAFLTWDDRIDDTRMVGFLERFHRERLADDHDPVWDGWLVSIAVLGLRHLLPLADDVWRAGRVAPGVMEWRDFEEILARAESEPNDIGRFETEHWGYIDDVVGSLGWSRYGESDGETTLAKPASLPLLPFRSAEPVRNPWRHVGRNDPCPCGSGKKAKRCCLTT
jgi:hypothetical protein